MIDPHELISMIHRLVLTTHLDDEVVCSFNCTSLLAFSTLKPQLFSSTLSESPLQRVGKPSNLALERMFVRLGLLHNCPVFAGTKLTNPILAEMEKRKKPKTLGVTRFQKPAVNKCRCDERLQIEQTKTKEFTWNTLGKFSPNVGSNIAKPKQIWVRRLDPGRIFSDRIFSETGVAGNEDCECDG